MSSPEHDFSDHQNETRRSNELTPDWHLPLFETKRRKRLNDWYTYLWCFCEISKRSVNSIETDDPIWLEELTAEIKRFREAGSKLDKRKNTAEDDTTIRGALANLIADSKLEKPAPTKIRHFSKNGDVLKGLIHDLKNAHTPMYVSLYTYQKSPIEKHRTELREQLILGFKKLQAYAQHAENVLMTIKQSKKGEILQMPIEEMNLFQLFEAIEQDLLSNLRAEDPSKSVQLIGMEEVRQFIENHPNLVFSGRPIDFKGLLSNIGKNCVEQYSEVRDSRYPYRANDERVMIIYIGLKQPTEIEQDPQLIISFSIEDRATGFTAQILETGFDKIKSEKSYGWAVGLSDYVRRMKSYLKILFTNVDFKSDHVEDQTGFSTGSKTTLEIPVKERY